MNLCLRSFAIASLIAITACSSTNKKGAAPTEAPAVAIAKAPEASDLLKIEMEKFIEASKPNRGVDQPGHEAAFRYLKNEFDTIAKKTDGAKVYVQEFFPDTRFASKNYQKDFETQIKGKYPPADPMYIKWKNFTDNAVKFVSRYSKIKGKNLILELPGTEQDTTNKDTRVLYVGAHYDTITHNHETMEFTPKNPTPGADDNASGVIGLLELAKYYSKVPHTRTLRFVAFDYEEIFFLGSYHLANTIKNNLTPWKTKNEKTFGLITLEMIGWSTKYITDRPLFKVYTRKKPDADKKETATNDPAQKGNLKENEVGIAGGRGIGLPPIGITGHDAEQKMARAILSASEENGSLYSSRVVENGFDRSDNWSFWQKEIPAVCVSQDWEQDFNEANYHTNRDTTDSINFKYMEAIIESLKRAIQTI